MEIRNQHSVQSLRCARDYCLYYYYYLFYLYTVSFRASLSTSSAVLYFAYLFYFNRAATNRTQFDGFISKA